MSNNGLDTLVEDDDLARWRKGKDKWNDWVKMNPNHNIDFKGADFSEYKKVDFSGFHFPNGDVDFSYAEFGDGNVDFSYAKFGDGYVSFFSAKFGDGYVGFSNVKFGNGDVDFSNAEFNGRYVNFSDAKFGDGDVNFIITKFGDGYVSFRNAKFGDVDVNFSRAEFGGGLDLSNIEDISKVKSFSFQGAVIDGFLNISSEDSFPCLVDLTSTKILHHVSLAGLNCILPRKGEKPWYYKLFPGNDWAVCKTAINPKDIYLARRLKELAEGNRDHKKAKEFQIMEWQAERTHKYPFGFLFKTEFWYEKLSDYGRSIAKPFVLFVFTILVYAGIYCYIAGDAQKWLKSLVYSASQMFAFLPNSRIAIEKMGQSLFGQT
ncbi:MAG: hypothetical protein KAJ29_07975, partial [Alphaproteobacteria bacterium]|nr:hypothetical protein [Alphaproteobacteria bacterium]